jgi:hypothetical protein
LSFVATFSIVSKNKQKKGSCTIFDMPLHMPQ